jgi:hypothetical protein
MDTGVVVLDVLRLGNIVAKVESSPEGKQQEQEMSEQLRPALKKNNGER